MRADKSELAKKISTMKNVVPKETTHPVLKGILFHDGHLTASDSFLSLTMSLDSAAADSEDESFLIPDAAFGMISRMPDGEIQILPDKDSISIMAPKMNVKFNTHRYEDFPLPKKTDDQEISATIDGSEFAKAINRVGVFIEAGITHSVTSAMLFQAADGLANMAALDGRRLGWTQIPCDGEVSMLIPRLAVNKLASLNLDCPVKIVKDENSATFHADDFTLTTRLIEGKFADYKRMLEGQMSQITVNRKTLLGAVERSKICAKDNEPIVFELAERTLTLTCKNKGTDFEEKIQLDTPAPLSILPLTIGLSPRMIAETLKTLDNEKVSLWFANQRSPMIISEDGIEYKGLIMPVNLAGR